MYTSPQRLLFFILVPKPFDMRSGKILQHSDGFILYDKRGISQSLQIDILQRKNGFIYSFSSLSSFQILLVRLLEIVFRLIIIAFLYVSFSYILMFGYIKLC